MAESRMIEDITNYIFLSHTPQRADIIFLPGGAFPEVPELAVKLYREGFAGKFLPAGGVSVKTGKFSGVKSKKEIYKGN